MPTEEELMVEGIIPQDPRLAVQGTLFPEPPEPQEGYIEEPSMADGVIV